MHCTTLRLLRGILTGAALGLFCSPLHASEWFVNANTGADANDGTTPDTAWLTLTHALASIDSTAHGAHLIHVAPGHYTPALGEQFPLVMRPLIRIVGDQGSAVTILQAPGATLLQFSSIEPTPGYFVAATSGADGLTLRNSSIGILLDSNWNGVSPAFHDVVIDGMQNQGVLCQTYGIGIHVVHPTFSDCTVVGCGTGVELEASGANSNSYGMTTVNLTDCVVDANVFHGLALLSGNGAAQVALDRCRITNNGGCGIYSDSGDISGTTIGANATLIARNQDSGVRGVSAVFSSSNFQLVDCTIADNVNVGFSTLTGPSLSQFTTLRNCILFGNGDDFEAQGGVTASYCDCGNGNLSSYPNCTNVNPMFANPANGDYRLRYSSPCIDSGDPLSNGALDLLGHTRPYDGDLDTLGAPDFGAFEFEPLHLLNVPLLGQDFGFEFWGATGSMSTLFVAKAPLMPGQSTTFGQFFLDPSSVLMLATVPARPGPPYLYRRTMSGNPILIGTTFSFQALTDSSNAPLNQAYTNATSFVVYP